MNEFKSILTRLRKEGKISQQTLASAIGVSQQCISMWEKGLIDPTLSNLCKIADFFDVSIDFLAGRKDY